MTTETTTHVLALTPLDLLVFRDGRPFDGAAQIRSGLPQPQTVACAVRSWLLARTDCDFERLAEDIKRGVTFAEACGAQGSEVADIGTVRFRGPWFSRGGKCRSSARTKSQSRPASVWACDNRATMRADTNDPDARRCR